MTTVEDTRGFDTDLDHHGPAYRENNYAYMAELQQRCPVAHDSAYGGYWLFTGYDVVFDAVRDPETFGSGMDKAVPANQMSVPLIPIDIDPPMLQRYRKLLLRYLSPAAAERQDDELRTLTTELIDAFIERGEADLSQELFTPLPARWILRFIGLDDSRWAEWIAWIHASIHDRANDRDRAMWGITNVYQAAGAEIASRREAPRDDLLSELIAADIDGNKLSDDELIGIVFLLMLGGMDTTAGLTGNSLLRIERDPALRQRLIDEPELMRSATEEFLRHDTPTQGIARVVRKDTVFHGRQLKAGDRVFLMYAAANRDPKTFKDPEEIILDREPNRHMAFALGVHRCVGSNFARAMFKIMVTEVLRRLPDFHLAGEVVRYPDAGDVYGVEHLPVTFTPGPREGSTPVVSGYRG
jgi:cytochrome P450